jgi:CBS domain-containing protein
MKTAEELFTLTAEDLMSRDVITIPQRMPLPDAVGVLAQAHIGGAPVVDGRGECVGVFSLADFARRTRPGNRASHLAPPVPGCVCTEWEVVQPDWADLPPDAVGRYMTPDPVTVPPETTLGEMAQRMVDAHIHRLIVTDAEGRPIGIVSSTDLLAAVAPGSRPEE